YIFLCLRGQPASDPSEAGLEKTLELLQGAAELGPVHLRDGRCAQFVNLWENQVQYTLRLYELVYMRQGAVHQVVDNYLIPLIKNIPYYLDRSNSALQYLWTATCNIHEDLGRLYVQHGIVPFKEFLLMLHEYF